MIDRIRANWPDKFLVKGILSAADARDAVDHGVDGVVVSNHGGRQIDAAPATLHALPAIVDAVARRVPVILDGGIRCGIDIAKAIALGADFTLIGRAPLYGAGADGAAGVAHALDILQGELGTALGQLGCPNIADLRNLECGQRKAS